jgi:hypothetical protein
MDREHLGQRRLVIFACDTVERLPSADHQQSAPTFDVADDAPEIGVR